MTGDPFATMGAVVVDVVDFGSEVGTGDFEPPVLVASVGTLSSDATLGVKECDVTGAFASDAGGEAHTVDLLVRCADGSTDGDAAADVVVFDDSEGDLGTASAPTLVVTFVPLSY